MKKNKYIRIGLLFILFSNTIWAATQEKEILAPDIALSMHNNILNSVQPHLVFSDEEKAKAWLNDMSSRLKKIVPDEFFRKEYLTIIQYEATRAGLDPQLILSIITVESKFKKYAISNSGAEGLMQVMPFWQAQLGLQNQSLFDPKTNVRFGCSILRYYIQKEHGNLAKALARYNGSIGQAWYPQLVFATYRAYWQPYPVMTMESNGMVKTIDYSINN